MLFLHLWRAVRAMAAETGRLRGPLGAKLRRRGPSRATRPGLARLDRRTLADIGIGPGAIVSLARDLGLERLRRPPHV